jgi:tripartite ATP-independent transporter DctP family solute receptor
MNRREVLQGATALTLAVSFGTPAQAATEFRFAHFSPTADPQHVTAEAFASALSAETRGQYTARIFPNAQLGGEVDVVEGILLGTIDISTPGAAVLANWIPEMNVLNMPFVFRDWDHYTKVAQGVLLDRIIEAAVIRNIRVLGMLTSGARHIMTTRPVEAIADMKGMKVRTVQNPVHVATFNAFGANATAIAYPEVYSSLQTGVVNGADAANTNYYSQKFYEVAPFWAQVSWLFYSNCLIMREDAFQALPAEIQATLQKVGRQTGIDHFARYRKSDEETLDLLIAEGVTVTRPDRAPFVDAAQSVYDEFLKTDEERALLALISGA